LKLGGESKEKSIFIGEAKKKLDQRNQQWKLDLSKNKQRQISYKTVLKLLTKIWSQDVKNSTKIKHQRLMNPNWQMSVFY
jgi:hypothetical protein